MSTPYRNPHEGTITRHELQVRVNGGPVSRVEVHYEVDCSCGKFHRKGPSVAGLHRKLDAHVAGATS